MMKGTCMNSFTKNLNRIECIVTWACSGRCKHCSQGDHHKACPPLNADKAVAAIQKTTATYPICSFMTFGGEPLLHPEITAALHAAARGAGIKKRQIITNGFFSKDPDRIREVAALLKDSGVNDLLLSVDAFHQETIPLEPVVLFAKALLEKAVPLRMQPAWLVSQMHDNPWNEKTRQLLAPFADMGIPVHEGNIIFPSGNALQYLSAYFEQYGVPENPYEDDPENITAISLEPDGTALNGNFYQTDILEILEQYHP